MKKLVKWTFCFQIEQLEELKALSKKTGVPQAVFVREGLKYVLKKYRYITTMRPASKDEPLYRLTRNRLNEE